MTLAEILVRVSAKHNLATHDLFAVTRSRAVSEARHEFFYTALAETPASSVEVGRMCGTMDHSSVLYGASRYAVRNDLPMPRGYRINWKKLGITPRLED